MKTRISVLILLGCAALLTAGGRPVTDRSMSSSGAKRDQVQRIYTAELGVREQSGTNDGSRVEEYLRYAKLRKGDPWCAAFVCWVLGKAGVANPRTGWSPALFPQVKLIWQRDRPVLKAGGSQKVRQRSMPKRGDVFGIWFPGKKRIAHAGFIDKWDAGWLITVEGNTNEAGSREGDGVYRKRRLSRSVWQVAGWIR